MTSISILTCVIGEPPELTKTSNSITPWLSEEIRWLIKFSDQTDPKFANNFQGEYIQHYSECDFGLYDAMNQCLNKANTDYYFVLGAGDSLLPDGMRALVEIMASSNLDKCSYHAPILMGSTNSLWTPEIPQLSYGMSCPHPTSLLRVDNSLAIGGYDTRYKIASDYDHLSRYANKFGFGNSLDIPPLVSFSGGGISDKHALESYLEVMLIRQRIWKAPDIRIYGDLLKGSANVISQIIDNSA